jgi:hypothetical protein
MPSLHYHLAYVAVFCVACATAPIAASPGGGDLHLELPRLRRARLGPRRPLVIRAAPFFRVMVDVDGGISVDLVARSVPVD